MIRPNTKLAWSTSSNGALPSASWFQMTGSHSLGEIRSGHTSRPATNPSNSSMSIVPSPSVSSCSSSCLVRRRIAVRSIFPQWTGPEPCLFNDEILAEQPLPILLDRGNQSLLDQSRIFRRDTHQHDARRRPSAPKDEIAEILVLRQQQPLFTHRQFKNLNVVRACGMFGKIQHVMAGLAQDIN